MTAAGNECVAELSRVGKVYARSGTETAALHDVSFRARPGELVLLLGPSGSGKTTLLTILAGLQRASSGEVLILGRRVEAYGPAELQRLRATRMGFIFQTFHLLDSLSVIDNVMLVLGFAGTPKREARRRAMESLEKLGIGHLHAASPLTLSQGEKQRVAVARALANKPALIIGDEPTGSLATQQGMTIVEILRTCVNAEGASAVIASHDERIAIHADRVLRMQDGRLI